MIELCLGGVSLRNRASRRFTIRAAVICLIAIASPGHAGMISAKHKLIRQHGLPTDGSTYFFYQDGYADGAFVAGFFTGSDLNGTGTIHQFYNCLTPTCEDPDRILIIDDGSYVATTENLPILGEQTAYGPAGGTPRLEVTAFGLFFSGNSLVRAFSLDEWSLTSPPFDDGDRAQGLACTIGNDEFVGCGESVLFCPDFLYVRQNDVFFSVDPFELFSATFYQTGGAFGTSYNGGGSVWYDDVLECGPYCREGGYFFLTFFGAPALAP